ncbi:MAG: pyridoxal-phosphate dependent enzyme, partial [Desulfobacterales bacterium]|nr:pyridoxal-phosphate dependent enzyme [Desulfobacterales bacterium]
QAWKNNEDVLTKPPAGADTVADSISAGLPRDRIKALRAVKETNGAFITVSDEQILKAIPDLARKTGVFAEPAGAATWAGVKAACAGGLIGPKETLAMINTGSGLKDINSAMKAVELSRADCFDVEPDLHHLKEILSEINI